MDLAFSHEETKQVLQNRLINLAQLHEQLEGWPAGVGLIAAGAPQHLAPKELVLERIDQLPVTLRDGLAVICVLEEWGESTPALLDSKLPTGWLKKVVALGLPLSPLGAGRYRAHTVLLEALEDRLRQRPKVRAAAHAKAGAIAELAGNRLLALRHVQVAGLTEKALELAEAVTDDQINNRDFLLARGILEQFDSTVLPVNLKVRLAQTLCETGQVEMGDTMLKAMYASGVRTAQLGLIMSFRASQQGRMEEQLRLVDEALPLADNARVKTNLLFMRSDGLEFSGDANGAVMAAEHAVTEAETSGDVVMLAKALSRLAAAFGNANNRHGCEQTFQRVLDVYDSLDMERRKMEPLNNLANYLSEWGHIDRALQTIEQALAIGTNDSESYRTALLGTRGLIRLMWGDPINAMQDFRDGLILAERHRMNRLMFNYRAWLCEAACLADDLSTSSTTLMQVNAVVPAGSVYHETWAAFLNGMIAFHTSNGDAAKTAWARMDLEELTFIQRARVLLYQAELARQDNTLAIDQIDTIFALWNEPSLNMPLIPEARVLKTLYSHCIKNRWQAPRFQKALEWTLKETTEPAKLKLMVNTFGSTRVSINGSTVKLPLIKCGELLTWFVLNGPSTRNAIVNALWDGSRRKADVEHARIVIRRLRAALSEHAAVTFNPLEFDGTRYGLNTAFEITCDAKTILDLNGLAAIEPSMLEHLNAFNGSFLEGCDTDWVQETTVQLTDAAINSFVSLGRQYEITQIEQALENYQRAIKLDPLANSAYEGIVRIQSQIGNTAAVQQIQTMLEQSEKRNLLN